MTKPNGIASINGFRDLPKVKSGIDEIFWFCKPEDWYLPPPQTVYGEQDSNSLQVYYAFKSRREVSSLGTFVAILRDALISPSGLVFLDDGTLLYESIFPWQLENVLDRFANELEVDNDQYYARRTNDIEEVPALFHAREGGEAGYFHFMWGGAEAACAGCSTRPFAAAVASRHLGIKRIPLPSITRTPSRAHAPGRGRGSSCIRHLR